jgi:hypothetical protein
LCAAPSRALPKLFLSSNSEVCLCAQRPRRPSHRLSSPSGGLPLCAAPSRVLFDLFFLKFGSLPLCAAPEEITLFVYLHLQRCLPTCRQQREFAVQLSSFVPVYLRRLCYQYLCQQYLSANSFCLPLMRRASEAPKVVCQRARHQGEVSLFTRLIYCTKTQM